VVIWRTLHGMSPYKGRSICDSCRRQLSWYENIPVVSFLVLRGKCRTCKKKIDWSYPLVEFVTGLLFLWWATLGFAFFQLTQSPLTYLQPLFWLVVGTVLIIIFFADVLYGIIPDFAVIVLGVLSVVYRLVLISSGIMQGEDFVNSVWVGLGVGIFYLTLFLLTKGKGMGFGDVKLSFVLGFLLGFPEGLVGTYFGFVLGGLFAGLLLLLKKRKFGQTIPFGPFMIIGVLVGLLWGDWVWFEYLKFLGW